MFVRAAVLCLILFAPAAAPAALTTTAPYDTVLQCLRDRLAPTGRVTAINTAAGAMLDYVFDSVGADGHVATAHIAFTIEDHGSERTLTASAASPGDAALAQLLLRQAGGRCAAADTRTPAHGAP